MISKTHFTAEELELRNYALEIRKKDLADKRRQREKENAEFRNHQHLETRLGKLWKEYQDLFKELRELDEDGHTEYAHIIQDEIYRKFILDTVSGRFKSECEYRGMALLMKINVVAYDMKGRWWYA